MFGKIVAASAAAVGSVAFQAAPVAADPPHHVLVCAYVAVSEYGADTDPLFSDEDVLWGATWDHCRLYSNWLGGCFEILVKHGTNQIIDLGGISCGAFFP